MRQTFLRAAFAACLVAGVACGAASANAADQKVSAAVGKPLSAAQAALKTNDWTTALAHVHEAQAVPNRTDFDDYKINQFLADIAINTKDFQLATTAMEAMADSPALPAEDKANVLTNAVLLAANYSDWPHVIKYGEALQAMGPLDPKVAGPLSIAYYNTGNAAKSAALTKSQSDAATAAGKVPDQSVLDVMLRNQLKQNDYTGASKTLEILVVNYNDPDAWGELVELAMRAQALREADAMHFYRLLVAANATIPADDYAIMGEVASNLHYPVEAEAIIQQGISKGVVKPGDKASGMLASIRPKADKDRSTIAGFEKEARDHYDLKLAETLFGYGRYADAADAAQRAIAKGGDKDPNDAQLVLGESLAMQGKNTDALAAFDKVNSGAAQKAAHLWTLYLQRKGAVAATH